MIEVDDDTKRSVAFAAQMAGITEAEIVRRMLNAASFSAQEDALGSTGVPIYADYGGRRTRALYFAPSRVEITDGPLKGQSFKSPTGAARAVVRHYNPGVNDNRNGWGFWQIETSDGSRVWLQAIRPRGAS